MKKSILSLLFVVLSLFSGEAQGQSFLNDDLTLDSRLLNKTMNYSVSLPPDYYTSGKSYPVLYLLHGHGNNHKGWVTSFKVNQVLDSLVAKGECAPMILVMPDGGVSWYINGNKESFESYFFEEFIPQIESKYRVLADKQHRAIAGISMGGYGALHYALKYPQLFSSCVALSSGVVTDLEIKQMPDEMYKLFVEPFGERTSEMWGKNSIFAQIQSLPAELKNAVRYYIDCGDDDFLYRGNDALHTAMRDASISHEYRVRDGAHTRSYWAPIIPDVLKFAGIDFQKP